MPQSQGLYGDLTVRENLDFFARIFGEKKAARRRSLIDESLDLVGLSDRAGSLTSTLSGGMRQRLSLACALVHEPELLLLDEPTVGVDPELRRGFWEHFRALNRRGVTIVVSSHVMDEADRCDRLALVRQGRVLAVGNGTEIREQAGSPTWRPPSLRWRAAPTVRRGRRAHEPRPHLRPRRAHPGAVPPRPADTRAHARRSHPGHGADRVRLPRAGRTRRS